MPESKLSQYFPSFTITMWPIEFSSDSSETIARYTPGPIVLAKKERFIPAGG